MKKLNKIMLISPESIASKGGIRRLTPPLGLLYLGAVLKEAGFDANILDSSCEGYNNLTEESGNYVSYGLSNKDLAKRLVNYSPNIVGISSPFSSRHEKACEISKLVRETFDVPIVMGGLHSTLFPKDLLKSGLADYVVLGEGDFRMRDLIVSLNNGNESYPNGIAWRKNGEILVKEPTTFIKDLDNIPFPARDLVNMEKYFEVAVPSAPYSRSGRVAQVFTSRGCPYNCNFCSTTNFWGRFRARSVDNIIGEIKELVDNYSVEEIQFVDDNLTLDKKRAMDLFEQLEQFNLSWCTPNGLMLQALDKKMLEAMAKGGAYQISVAVESGSERVRKEIIHKHVPKKSKVKELVDIARDNGIQTHAMFVLGFPGETKEEIYQTLNYPFEVGFDSVSYFIVNPLPGSKLYNECLNKGYIDKKKNRIDFRTAAIRIPKNNPDYYGMNPEQLEILVEQKTKEFNEFSMRKNPRAWEEKFESFLRKHPEEREKIFGRIQ